MTPGRVVRQSLSSQTADTIEKFKKGFSDLQDAFKRGIKLQHVISIDIMKTDLRDIKETFSEFADDGRFHLSLCDTWS